MKNNKIKIIVLGSSASSPFPRTQTNRFGDYLDIENYQKKFPLHDDPLCLAAQHNTKDCRTRSSVAIVTPDQTILLEAGPDVRYQLNKFKIHPDAVFITHNHFDANYGLKYLSGVKVYSEIEGNVKPGKAINFGQIAITPFRVLHATNTTCVGYAIDWLSAGEPKRFVYMTDLGSLQGVERYIKNCDILFADGSTLTQSMPSHLSIIKQLDFYRSWKIKKVFFTHIGHSTMPYADLRKFLKNKYENADVTYDGMSIDFLL
ncbi:MAG: MBL fold metallo-hydrolase [Candidatus Magasanikbacteria bacterium]